ncbi:site-2 protease family protein [bacterium]|nr:site-2 protease family protein [bacterium]
MSILLIVIGIVMFMILILLHEFGHFRAAKKTGVKVNEF